MKKPQKDIRNKKEADLATVLQQVIGSNKNLETGMDTLHVKAAWNAVMGNAIANYTLALDYKNGVLYVALRSAQLREELSFGRQLLIKRLNDYLKKDLIKDLILR